MKKMLKEEKKYYFKHMKKFKIRKCSHAGTWYSKVPKKLNFNIKEML